MMMHLDLFSGIGGFALAVDWVWPNAQHIFCEIEEFPQKILRKHWPNAEIYKDIKELDGKQWRGTIDLLTGGFPCQSFSVAGKRKGKADDRYLWPEMFRLIQETRPAWILAENVTGIIHLALDDVLSDLESEAYETETFVIPACGVSAPHRRDRVWIVAYAARGQNNGRDSGVLGEKEEGRQSCDASVEFGSEDVPDSENLRGPTQQRNEPDGVLPDVADAQKQSKRKQANETISEPEEGPERTESGRRSYAPDPNKLDGDGKRLRAGEVPQLQEAGLRQDGIEGVAQSGMGHLADGLSPWLVEPDIPRIAEGVEDRVNKLKALGNAIVPQVAAVIMGAIKASER